MVLLRAAVERFMALLDEIHPLAVSMRSEEVLDLVLDRTGFLDWMAGQANRRTHVDHVRALRDLLAASDAPDLGTWLADLHLGDVEAGPSDSAGGAAAHNSRVEGAGVAGRFHRGL